jgi:hypothetical protein
MNMISWLKKVFFTPLGTRMSREERNQSRGVALLMVIMGLAVMTSVVADLSYNETIRYQMAVHTRDSVKAEALAAGGLNWARLFLVIQDKIQNFIVGFAAQGMPLPSYTIWELLPIDSDLLKGLITGDLASSFGIDVKEALAKRSEKRKQKEESGSIFGPEGGFGNFDGAFRVEIVDEESKISLQNFGGTDKNTVSTIRKLLAALISPKRYDDIFDGRGSIGSRVDRPSVIANIRDWVDPDDIRTDPYVLSNDWGWTGSGSEREPYANDKGILPKNAYFDSLGELRLVHGITYDFEQSFFDAITIYGQGGKINILSAKDQVIEAVMRFCALNPVEPLFESLTFADEMLKKWRDYGAEGAGPMSVQGFTNFLEAQGLTIDKKACQGILQTASKNFTMTAKATVNDVTRTLILTARVVDNAEEMNYFRSR